MPLEKVDLLIDQKLFRFWSEVELTDAIDEFSSCTFSAPFEHQHKEFRETFRPFTFKPLTVLHDRDNFFTGRVVDISPEAEANYRTVTVTGYALPGVFGDCTAPAPTSEKPQEFKGIDLEAICKKLADPFGIECEFPDGAGPVFKEPVKLNVDQKIQDFLQELGKQRNRVFSNTATGKLLCWQSAAVGNPVAHFTTGTPPVTKVVAKYNPQEYYSEITGFAKKGRRGKVPAKWTEPNPWLEAVLRPDAFKLDDAERGDAPEATRAKLGRMFANILSIDLPDLPTWRDPQGQLFRKNTTVTLLAPECMVYRRTEFLIRKVARKQNAKSETCTLTLVLPGAFSGEIPNVLPWDE